MEGAVGALRIGGSQLSCDMYVCTYGDGDAQKGVEKEYRCVDICYGKSPGAHKVSYKSCINNSAYGEGKGRQDAPCQKMSVCTACKVCIHYDC